MARYIRWVFAVDGDERYRRYDNQRTWQIASTSGGMTSFSISALLCVTLNGHILYLLERKEKAEKKKEDRRKKKEGKQKE